MPKRDPQRVAPDSATPSRPTGRRPSEEPFTFARSSIASEEHPERNEDYVTVDRSRGLAAVFDGVGGITGGEIASQIAAHSIQAHWKRLVECHSQNLPPSAPEQHGRQHARLFMEDAGVDLAALLRGLVEEAHAHIRSEGVHRVRDRYITLAEASCPKTTAALVALCRSSRSPGYRAVYAWVGDSRIYLLSQRTLTRLTADDGLLTELVKLGLLDEQRAARIDQATIPQPLSKQELLFFEKRNGITQALGDELTPTVHVQHTDIAPGDRLLLCTDGIHDNLTDNELETLLRQGARTTVARRIVLAAGARSHQDTTQNLRAKPDDMSAVVLTCHY